MFTLLGGEGVDLSGLYLGGLSNQLYCEFANIKHKILFLKSSILNYEILMKYYESFDLCLHCILTVLGSGLLMSRPNILELLFK